MTHASRAGWAVFGVLATTVVSLRVADAVAGLLADLPRGAHLDTSLTETEARLGVRLDLLRRALTVGSAAPRILRLSAPPAVTAVLYPESDPQKHITFFQSVRGEIPTRLRPEISSFHEISLSLGAGQTASLRAASLADGSVLQDLEWPHGAGRAALRSRGRTVDLIRQARQMIGDAP